MPLHFSSIPDHLQNAIIQKFQVRDFVRFQRSSRRPYNKAFLVRSQYTVQCYNVDVDETTVGIQHTKDSQFAQKVNFNDIVSLPIRLEGREIYIFGLTDDLSQRIKNFLLTTNSSFSSLFSMRTECSLKSLTGLLQVAKVTEFSTNGISKELLGALEVENVTSFHVISDLNDNDLLSLKVPTLQLLVTHITSIGIKYFLEEWLCNKRKISHIIISTMRVFEKNIILDNIEFSVSRDDKNREICTITNSNKEQLNIQMDTQFIVISNGEVMLT